MARRHRIPSAGTPRAGRKPVTTGPITSASPPPDSAVSLDPALAATHPPESVHDALLESVSPEALHAHDDAPNDPVDETIAEPAPEPEPAIDPEPAVQAAQDGAPSDESPVEPHDSEPVPDGLPEGVAPEILQSHDDAPSDPVIETSAESEPATYPAPVLQGAPDIALVDEATPEPFPAPIVVPVRAAPAPAFRRASALDALNELTESNATVVAFLRNEGSATLAHWRSLAGARSAADVVRLQVDEMQRAADASLTCVSTLAKQAGRFANLLGRR